MVEEVTDGGRKPRVTDDEILAVLRDHSDPVLSTAEIADRLPIKRRGTLNRLRELEEEGAVVSKQIGGRNTVWWLTREPDQEPAPLADPGPENDIAASDIQGPSDGAADRAKPGDDAPIEPCGGPSSGPHPGGNASETGLQETGSAGTDLQDVESDGIPPALADVDFPGGRDRRDCVDAVLAARAHLQETGAATKSELVREVMPDHPLGYDVDGAFEKLDAGERYRGAWWRRVVKPGLEALPDVQKPSRGASDWRYTGPAGESEGGA